MPVKFRQNTQENVAPPQTVEASIKAYTGWAGIHDHWFLSQYEDTDIVVTPSSGWEFHTLPATFTPEVVIEYTITGLNHGVAFHDGDNYIYMVVTDDGNVVVRSGDGMTETTLLNIEGELSFEGQVTFCYREQRFDESQEYLWRSITLWMNDMLVHTFTQRIANPHSGSMQISLLAAEEAKTFTGVRVPQLTELIEWSSLDPGETPLSGMNRGLEGRYTKMFFRFNGAIKVWRPVPNSAVWSFGESDLHMLASTFSLRELFTHVRMLGAYEQAEFHRPDLTARYGHRFVEVSNPYLMTVQACEAEAKREIMRMEERATTEVVSTLFTPLLEPEDHVITPMGHRIITSRDVRYEPGKVTQQLTLRKYTGIGS